MIRKNTDSLIFRLVALVSDDCLEILEEHERDERVGARHLQAAGDLADLAERFL